MTVPTCLEIWARITALDLDGWARVATILGWGVAATGLVFSVRSFRSNVRTSKAKFVSDLMDSFVEKDLHQFWYRLDYTGHPKSWKFDLAKFKMSEDERLLDTILYKFAVVGHMLKSKALKCGDIEALIPLCRRTFENLEVRKYLKFYVLDFYCAVGMKRMPFPDALYRYQELTRHAASMGIVQSKAVTGCEDFLRQLRELQRDSLLRATTAREFGYQCDCVKQGGSVCSVRLA